MYNISDLISVITFIAIVYNTRIMIIHLIKKNQNMYEELSSYLIFFNDLLKFMSDNNPLLIDYYDNQNKDEEEEEDKEKEDKEKDVVIQKVEQKYEDKYLEKFKKFPNEFQLSRLEEEEEKREFDNIQITATNNRIKSISKIAEQLLQINEIEERGNIVKDGLTTVKDETTVVTSVKTNVKDETNKFTENINQIGKDGLLTFFNMDDDDEDYDFEELYMFLLEKKTELKNKLKEIQDNVLTEDEMRVTARENIINKKLDKFIDNYILEYTPLGNIYMRYNNSKKSFEYFSNNTMPYRYLEPVGRKYVMTYWCKPIFVDIEEELKKSELKFDADVKQKEDDKKRREEELKNGPKDVIVKLKNYNKETKNQATMKQQMKNRSDSNMVLPPQIKANLPNVKTNEKPLLKENANRYTCEGRLTEMSPLKKIDKKVTDKNLSMSYLDFKKMQKDNK